MLKIAGVPCLGGVPRIAQAGNRCTPAECAGPRRRRRALSGSASRPGQGTAPAARCARRRSPLRDARPRSPALLPVVQEHAASLNRSRSSKWLASSQTSSYDATGHAVDSSGTSKAISLHVAAGHVSLLYRGPAHNGSLPLVTIVRLGQLRCPGGLRRRLLLRGNQRPFACVHAP